MQDVCTAVGACIALLGAVIGFGGRDAYLSGDLSRKWRRITGYVGMTLITTGLLVMSIPVLILCLHPSRW